MIAVLGVSLSPHLNLDMEDEADSCDVLSDGRGKVFLNPGRGSTGVEVMLTEHFGSIRRHNHLALGRHLFVDMAGETIQVIGGEPLVSCQLRELVNPDV